MKALITGDQGFVGRHLRALLGQEMVVVGFDLEGGQDIRSYESIRQAVERIEPDYVFHLAAQASPPESLMDPRRGLEVNVGGTLNLLEAVRHTGIHAKILIAGTSEEIGYNRSPGERIDEDSPCRPTQPYGVTKFAASQMGLVYAYQYGLHVVVTRAFNHVGPGMPARYAVGAFAKRLVEIERGQKITLTHGNLSAVRNFTDVRDVVRAYRLVIDQPAGRVFIVCSSVSRTMREVLNIMINCLGQEVRLELDPALHRPDEKGVFPRPSYAKLHAATGWGPEIPLEKSLQDVINYYRGQ